MLNSFFPVAIFFAGNRGLSVLMIIVHILMLGPGFFSITLAYYPSFKRTVWFIILALVVIFLCHWYIFEYKFPSNYNFAGYELGAIGMMFFALIQLLFLIFIIILVLDISNFNTHISPRIKQNWIFYPLIFIAGINSVYVFVSLIIYLGF